jgi:hypothetical protein
MFFCLSANSYPLLADIYESVDVQEEPTGVVGKAWRYKETVSCSAKGQISTGIDRNAANMDSGQKTIQTKELLKIRTQNKIPTYYRVVRVRNDFGVVWTEDTVINTDGGLEGSTIFEPKSSIPILDHNGRVIEYEITISRQDIQKLTLYSPPEEED